MSKENEADHMSCATCGKAEVDDVELKACACNLVKYCSDGCRELDQPKHVKVCRKRLAELRDKDLFKQPDERHLGECPICCLPLPIEVKKSTFTACCSKALCKGCCYANQKREFEQGLEHRCAFCREPAPETDEEVEKNRMERIKKNDPAAMSQMGEECYREGDFDTAFEYLPKAAALGDADALFYLSNMYYLGEGVEKNMKKAIYHAEQAAIAGHPEARHNLGVSEAENGRFERAKKHWIIAANLGYNDSLKMLRQLYTDGHASKDDYAAALRAYQAAVDETKSAKREKAEKAEERGEW